MPKTLFDLKARSAINQDLGRALRRDCLSEILLERKTNPARCSWTAVLHNCHKGIVLVHWLWQQVVRRAREAETQPEELSPLKCIISFTARWESRKALNVTTICSTSPKTESSGSRTCILPMQGTTIRRPIESHPSEAIRHIFLKRVTNGRKAKSQKKQKLNKNSFLIVVEADPN